MHRDKFYISNPWIYITNFFHFFRRNLFEYKTLIFAQRVMRSVTVSGVRSSFLNRRLVEFLREKSYVFPREAFQHDSGLQSCPYTDISDGRHYHPLNLVRIRLLFFFC